MMAVDADMLQRTLSRAEEALLAARSSRGPWTGELSSSALSTATATCALAMLDRARRTDGHAGLVTGGLRWLRDHQNADGGWGDTVDSPSNISTTTLAWGALGIPESTNCTCRAAADRAEAWLLNRIGELRPERLVRAIVKAYGEDRTFSAPILTQCALSGRLGAGGDAWALVPQLPFELAACPHGWLRRIGLPMVSYALPALIAIGQVRHHHCPTSSPLLRMVRDLTKRRTLHVLEAIQPPSGGFLEAPPLTSFVVMSLACLARENHVVVEKGERFLVDSVRADGSWPIDTNLTTWVTTLAVNALTFNDRLRMRLSVSELGSVLKWLLDQQYTAVHPYTHAAPGGWAWTDLSGGVPDADDTAGALLALHHLSVAGRLSPDIRQRTLSGARAGATWLMDLQNADGGIPTFCRGWSRLPFDRSTPDLTAHALRAWVAWADRLGDGELTERIGRSVERALEYLIGEQRADGSWVPLWFGNQQASGQENPLYGTTRVMGVPPDRSAGHVPRTGWARTLRRAMEWVLSAQNEDGGWGGHAGVASTIEETGLAVEALAGADEGNRARVAHAVSRGCAWLMERTEGGSYFPPSPMGLYFAKLWYAERLYPLVFTVGALNRAVGAASHDRRLGSFAATR